MTLKADTDISTEDLIQAAKNMVARATVSGLQVSGPNIQVSAFYGAPVLLEKVAARLQTYHQGVKSFADMLEEHEYAHQFIGSGLIDLVRLDVALAQLTSHDNRAHAGHCVLQETMNEAADLLATAPLFNPGEATMVLVNKAISLLRERPSIRDGRQPTLVEELVQQLEDATRQCAQQAALLKEALPDVREGLAGTSAVDLASRIESALAGQLPVLDNTPGCVLSADAGHEPAPAVQEDWKLVPFNPTEDQWGDLARAIVFWMRIYPSHQQTPSTLVEFITSLGYAVPDWMAEESELKAPHHVISKGTVAALIYKAMIAVAPKPEGGAA